MVNWGSRSRCCDAIGFCPHPPFIVSCCREVSHGRGGWWWRNSEGRREVVWVGPGLLPGVLWPPQRGHGLEPQLLMGDSAQLMREGCPPCRRPVPIWGLEFLTAELCKLCLQGEESANLAPCALCLGEGPVLLKLGEIQRRAPMASWEREKRPWGHNRLCAGRVLCCLLLGPPRSAPGWHLCAPRMAGAGCGGCLP